MVLTPLFAQWPSHRGRGHYRGYWCRWTFANARTNRTKRAWCWRLHHFVRKNMRHWEPIGNSAISHESVFVKILHKSPKATFVGQANCYGCERSQGIWDLCESSSPPAFCTDQRPGILVLMCSNWSVVGVPSRHLAFSQITFSFILFGFKN